MFRSTVPPGIDRAAVPDGTRDPARPLSVPSGLVPFERASDRLPGPDIARTLAIGAVIACHGGIFGSIWLGLPLPLHVAYLGFHGVTLFFVLSGFLIGTIMLDLALRDAPAASWGIFLVRRWARTLPAYYAWLLLLVVPLALAGHGGSARDVRDHWVSYLTLTQNLFWKPVSPWFGVSWSLCVEEWFYLLFPACFVLLRGFRLGGRTAFVATMLLFMLVPVAWRSLLPAGVRWDEVTSRMAVCRFDSIGWGVLAAWACRFLRWPRRHAAPLLALGSALFGAMWWHDALLPSLSRFGAAWNEAMLDVTALAFALCMPATMRLPPGRGSLTRLARTISTHSYALYLGHLSLILLAGDMIGAGLIGPPAAIAVAAAMMTGGAVLSWRLVERPVLAIRPRQR